MLPTAVVREILTGLLGADHVGFHSPRWSEAFLRCCARFLSAEVDLAAGTVRWEGRTVRTGVHPLGTAADEIRAKAHDEDAEAGLAHLREVIGDRKVISRVDRTELSKKSLGKVSFLDREMMKTLVRERELKQTGQVQASADTAVNEFKGADFFLTGKLQGLSTRTSQGTSDYILYSFRLTDARTSEIVWEDSAEIKKQGLEEAAYR